MVYMNNHSSLAIRWLFQRTDQITAEINIGFDMSAYEITIFLLYFL